MRKNPNDKVLKPVRPNLGIEAAFRRSLRKLIEQMHTAVMNAVLASYKANPPAVAQDAVTGGLAQVAGPASPPQAHAQPGLGGGVGTLPLANPLAPALVALDSAAAASLTGVIRGLTRQWLRKFNKAAPRLAKYFSEDINTRSTATLQKILKDAGITVKFKLTAAQQDVLKATIEQQVSLIKSIPSTYLHKVEGAVMRSIQQGRDLKSLTDELEHNFKLTRNKAAFIARDQVNKATAALTRVRQMELGIEKAVWVHSGGGKHPRPLHVKWGKDKKTYDVAKGMWDSHEQQWIHPGQLINCRCISKPVIEGFS